MGVFDIRHALDEMAIDIQVWSDQLRFFTRYFHNIGKLPSSPVWHDLDKAQKNLSQTHAAWKRANERFPNVTAELITTLAEAYTDVELAMELLDQHIPLPVSDA
jgi:hypothetical protein